MCVCLTWGSWELVNLNFEGVTQLFILLLDHLLLVEVEFLSLEDVSVNSSALSGSAGDAGEDASLGELLLDGDGHLVGESSLEELILAVS